MMQKQFIEHSMCIIFNINSFRKLPVENLKSLKIPLPTNCTKTYYLPCNLIDFKISNGIKVSVSLFIQPRVLGSV